MESLNLIIRESIFSDCTIFSEWERKEYIQENFTMSGNRDYEEIVKEFILDSMDSTKLQYTIICRDGEKPIGRIQISNINEKTDSLDITRIYIGEESYLAKGLGKEAMHLLLDHCYIKLHTERVTLDHIPYNEKLSRFYKKLGFQYEGILRNAGKKNGRYVDFHLMSMLRSEYFEKYRTIV